MLVRLIEEIVARSTVPKSKILNVALELFSTKGFSETKMVEIARGAGLSVGALYLRFKNKEELCLEIIKDQTQDYFERTEALAKNADKNPLQAFKEYISFCLECSTKKKQLLHIFYREYRLPFIHPLRDHFFRTQSKIIESILKKGIKNSMIRPLNTKETAMSIFASIRGAIMLKVIYGAGSPEVLGNSLYNIICHGIRKGTP